MEAFQAVESEFVLVSGSCEREHVEESYQVPMAKKVVECPLKCCSCCLFIFHNYHYFPLIHSPQATPCPSLSLSRFLSLDLTGRWVNYTFSPSGRLLGSCRQLHTQCHSLRVTQIWMITCGGRLWLFLSALPEWMGGVRNGLITVTS